MNVFYFSISCYLVIHSILNSVFDNLFSVTSAVLRSDLAVRRSEREEIALALLRIFLPHFVLPRSFFPKQGSLRSTAEITENELPNNEIKNRSNKINEKWNRLPINKNYKN